MLILLAAIDTGITAVEHGFVNLYPVKYSFVSNYFKS